MLTDAPLGCVLGGDGLDAYVLDAGDVVDAAIAVVGEAEDPLVEPEAADSGCAPDIPQDQVVRAFLAAFEAGLDPAGGRFRRGGMAGALLSKILLIGGSGGDRRLPGEGARAVGAEIVGESDGLVEAAQLVGGDGSGVDELDRRGIRLGRGRVGCSGERRHEREGGGRYDAAGVTCQRGTGVHLKTPCRRVGAAG